MGFALLCCARPGELDEDEQEGQGKEGSIGANGESETRQGGTYVSAMSCAGKLVSPQVLSNMLLLSPLVDSGFGSTLVLVKVSRMRS